MAVGRRRPVVGVRAYRRTPRARTFVVGWIDAATSGELEVAMEDLPTLINQLTLIQNGEEQWTRQRDQRRMEALPGNGQPHPHDQPIDGLYPDSARTESTS